MHHLLGWPRAVAASIGEVALGAVGIKTPDLAPTPRDVIATDGSASLYSFPLPEGVAPAAELPLLLVPSLINRWYVLDLRRGASLVEALTRAGIKTYCLDWGTPEDEDRYLSWEQVVGRLDRAVKRVLRREKVSQLGILGYCMGGTLSGIYAAMHPERIAALVNLAGPFDFSEGGALRKSVDPRWFDPAAIAAAGNVSPLQMQSGFSSLRPTLELAKSVGLPDLATNAKARDAFMALEAWASDNIPFPGAAYETYIRELYQENRLMNGTHRVGGASADLAHITAPLLTIVASRDQICPPAAAAGLAARASSTDTTTLTVDGGHVGAVVGSRAAREMYPQTCAWLTARLSNGG